MDTRTFDLQTLKIRELNDVMRQHFPSASRSGQCVLTQSISSFIEELGSVDKVLSLMNIVRDYNAFTDDNDPYGEHDLAFFEFE